MFVTAGFTANRAAKQRVPEGDILLEDWSATIRENIEPSIDLLRDAGVGGPRVLVTGEYHVIRTASLARRLGADAQVVGSRTAAYYVRRALPVKS